MAQEQILEVEKVHKAYGDLQVLRGIDFSLCKGEVVCIIGPSGSGKSTLLRCLNMLEKPDAGRILLKGEEVFGEGKLKGLDQLRRELGMVFQNFNLFPHLCAIDNVSIGQTKVLGRKKAVADEKSKAMLASVGLEDKMNEFPDRLSGGQQQRVAIARALAMDPEVMLFDEVTSALDPELVKGVLDVLRKLADEGMTMVCVTHEMGFAKKVASRVIFMDKGQIVEDDAKDAFFGNPRSERARQFLAKILSH